MNKNFRSGGIKFRELDYSNQSSQSQKQVNKPSVRSREDVLKLFADAGKDDKQKENHSENIDGEKFNDITEKDSKLYAEIDSCQVKDNPCVNVDVQKFNDEIEEDAKLIADFDDNEQKENQRANTDAQKLEDNFEEDAKLFDNNVNCTNESIENPESKIEKIDEFFSDETEPKEVKKVVLKSQTQMKLKFENIPKPLIQTKPTFRSIVKPQVQTNTQIDIVRDKSKIQSPVIESFSKPKSETTTVEKRIYNVMVGKISTRKHKQWDSDGILEVSGKSAVLKDTNGKYLGKTTVKPETIEEGFRICMGGKEIEIVELVSSQDVQNTQASSQKCSSSESMEPPAKKAKLSKGFVPVKSGNSLHFNYEPLIMPNPPVNLEWSEENLEQKIHEVSIDGCLASVLRPHQREGLVFLYKCIMGMNDPKYKGAILADEMGLGKTLQCISLVWTLLKKGPHGKPVLKRVLIVAPSSLCGNWNKEFKRWLGSIKIAPYVVEGKQKVKDFTKTPRACVMIISYEMFVRNVDDVNSLNFDLIICDEGHRLKNSEVKTLKFLSQMNCQRRILLSGTPVQNDLQEFYTLANFVNPGILGSFSEYKRYYEHSIVTSQRATANEEEVTLGQERAKELYERSKTFILRRTNNLINNYLPQKHELVIFCRPTMEQNNLYGLITDYWFNRSVIDGNVMPLAVITALKKVCNHPYLFTGEKSNILEEVLPVVPTNLSAISNNFSYSTKFKIVRAVFQNLKQTQEKMVLVSYFTQTLDLLERVCGTEGLQFCRLDGNTPAASRTKLVDRFNSKDNSACRVFLLSAKAGGVGLNLIGASRLILFDSDWNPANDAQAMARIWRDGQKRSVYIYRLLTTGTIEEKIYQRQISKTGLSEAVVDANHISSLKLSASELKDLFTLDSKTYSVTHDLMDCSCTGSGEIPYATQSESNSEDSRNCQFDLKKKKPQQQITINQLLSWQHFKNPISVDLMKELMLNQVQDHITFIFKNSVEKIDKPS